MAANSLDQIKDHIRNRSYMSGIEREYARVKSSGEVFTPTAVVQRMLSKIPVDGFQDTSKVFLDNSCGDGQFLGEILILKMENGSSFEQALSTIYGVDLMQDNVDLCRERLLCGREDLRPIVEQNIQCRDALKFGYNFEPMGPARRNTEEKARIRQQKLKVKQKKEAHQKKLFGAILN
jgi:hypothetical protein